MMNDLTVTVRADTEPAQENIEELTQACEDLERAIKTLRDLGIELEFSQNADTDA